MQFWEMDHPGTGGQAWCDDTELKRLEAQHGHMHPWFRAMRVPGVPQPVRLVGNKVKDFTWTWFNQCLIQDRVLHMFEDQGFTGYQTHPVSAKWKRRPVPKAGVDTASDICNIPTLWELMPTGWGGVAPKESGMHVVGIRPSDGLRTYSKYTDPSKLIDENQWDGSDFFIVWPIPFHIFVSDKVAQFIKNEKLTGPILTRVQDLDWGSGDDCMPAQLHYYLPEPRAKEIGEPLGIY